MTTVVVRNIRRTTSAHTQPDRGSPVFTALLERVNDVRHHNSGVGRRPAPVNAPGVAPQLGLSAGLHPGPHEGACFMELASFLAGARWSDQPGCTHPVIAVLASSINDMLAEQNRHLLAPLIPAVIGTQRHTLTVTQDLILCLRLAAWCTRQGLAGVADREAAGAAQAWADCPWTPTRPPPSLPHSRWRRSRTTAASGKRPRSRPGSRATPTT